MGLDGVVPAIAPSSYGIGFDALGIGVEHFAQLVEALAIG
jgi:hypothetical protein